MSISQSSREDTLASHLAPAPSADTMYEVLAVRYATQYATKSRWFHRYEVYGEPDEQVELDYYIWVLRNADRTIVVDTGFASAPQPPKRIHLYAHPVQALRRIGVAPESVSEVILTHFHYDHIGNIDAFPNAEIITARAEFDFWGGPYGDRRPLNNGLDRPRLQFLRAAHRDGRVRLVEDGERLVEGVTGILLAGHTPGQLGVLVNTPDGLVILSSDAAHYYEEVEKDRPFAIFADMVGMYRSYDTLRELIATQKATLVPGHDPAVMTRFRPLDHDGLAVRIGPQQVPR